MGIVREIAAEKAKGPSSLNVELLDALSFLDADGILVRAKVI
jgi:hypothetical protein